MGEITVRDLRAIPAKLRGDDVVSAETGGDYESWLGVYREVDGTAEYLGDIDNFFADHPSREDD